MGSPSGEMAANRRSGWSASSMDEREGRFCHSRRPESPALPGESPSMALLSLNDVSLTFSGPPLLDSVSLQIDDGERLGLLGRNGAGKSTLLKLLEGTLAPDAGTVARQPRLRVAGLQQDVPLDLT